MYAVLGPVGLTQKDLHKTAREINMSDIFTQMVNNN